MRWYFRLCPHAWPLRNQFSFQNLHSWDAATGDSGRLRRPGPGLRNAWPGRSAGSVTSPHRTEADTSVIISADITSSMGKFSLARLVMCAKYQRLTSEDYVRLGLCLPDNCQDCAQGHGHYVKNDKMVSKEPRSEIHCQKVPKYFLMTV